MRDLEAVLVVSASAGSGHLRAGEALSEALIAGGGSRRVEHVDVLELAPRWVRAAYAGSFELMAQRAPWLWREVYARTDGPASDAARWGPVAHILTRALPGHEEENARTLVGAGVALSGVDSGVGRALEMMFESPPLRAHKLGAFVRPVTPSGSLLSSVALAVQRALRVLEKPPYALLSVLPNYDLDTGRAPGLSPLRDIFVADPFRIRELGIRSWYSA